MNSNNRTAATLYSLGTQFVSGLLLLLLLLLLQLSCHSVAVVLSLVQKKQIRININKRNNIAEQCNIQSTAEQCNIQSTAEQCNIQSTAEQCNIQSTAEQCNIQTPIRTQYMQPHHHRINHTHRCILMDYFNSCNFSKHKLMLKVV